MKEHFLTYEQSLAVKELGFDEPCLKMSEHRKPCPEQEKPNGCQLHNLHCGYPNCTIDKTITPIPLPLKSQFFKWVRENKLTDASINRHGTHDGGYSYRWDIMHEYGVYEERHFKLGYKTYEEAEEACINEIIELIKG